MLGNLLLTALLLACQDNRASIDTPTSDSRAASADHAAIVLDAVPLSTTFQRFFGVDTEIFSPQQRQQLGTISYVGQSAALLNGSTKRQLDQAYLKTLREVLLEQCQRLATREAQALPAADAGDVFSEHVLLKRYGAPKAAEVSAIMTHMFGYRKKGELHQGASDYAALMADNLTTFQQKNSTAVWQEEVPQQYVLLCMAIGQDTRVYLR